MLRNSRNDSTMLSRAAANRSVPPPAGTASQDEENLNLDSVDEALSVLEGSKIAPGQRKGPILEQVDRAISYLSQASSTHGLVPHHLNRLIDLVKSKHKLLKITRTLRLVKCLIPSSVVPEEATLKVISWLPKSNVSKSIKVQLFKWVLAVYCYEVEASKDKIQEIYDVVFCFLFDDDVREFTAHLLYVITRQGHVTQSRIRQLYTLNQKQAKPYIAGLLSLYQVYCAEVVRILPKGKRIFRPPDEWKKSYQKVREKNIELEMGPFMKHCCKGTVDGFSLALDREIDNYSDFLEIMTHSDSKSSIAQIVASKNRRHLFTSSAGHILKLKIDNWIQVAGYDFYLSTHKMMLGPNFLENVAEILKELPEENFDARIFLQDYVTTWNGVDNQEIVFSLISTMEIYEFDLVHESVLENMETLFLTGNTSFKRKYIGCLKDLCQNWILHKLPLIKNDEEYQEAEQTIRRLLSYVKALCSCALIWEGSSSQKPGLIAAILEFHRDILLLVIAQFSKFLVSPDAILVYVSLFSFSTLIVNQLCSLFVLYEKAIGVLKTKPGFDRSLLKTINSFIVDISNCLWRRLMFQTDENSRLFREKFLPPEISQSVKPVNENFAFYRHPAFIIYTREFLTQKKLFSCDYEDVQRVTELRDEFLQFLDRPECRGLLNFLRTFVNMHRRKP